MNKEKNALDKQLQEMRETLNRRWSEKYVNSNTDLEYIRKAWNLTSVIQEGIGYDGEQIQPWSSVEQPITNCYLDLISDNTTNDSSSKRVESLMLLYDIVLLYIVEKFDKKQPGDLEKYLKFNILQLNKS